MVHPDRDGSGAPGDAAVERIRIPFIRRAHLAAGDRAEDAFVIDLGIRGAFVERAEPLPVGTNVVLAFQLPGNERNVVARARVAWWHPAAGELVPVALPSGLGIEFLSFEGDGEVRVRRHVLEYLGRSPRLRRFNRRPEAAGESGR